MSDKGFGAIALEPIASGQLVAEEAMAGEGWSCVFSRIVLFGGKVAKVSYSSLPQQCGLRCAW